MKLGKHLRAASLGIPAPKTERYVLDVILPGSSRPIEVYVEATPWEDRIEVHTAHISLTSDVRMLLEEAVSAHSKEPRHAAPRDGSPRARHNRAGVAAG